MLQANKETLISEIRTLLRCKLPNGRLIVQERNENGISVISDDVITDSSDTLIIEIINNPKYIDR